MACAFAVTRVPIGSFVVLNMWISPISMPVKLAASAVYGIGIQWVFIITYKFTKILRAHNLAMWFVNYIAWLRNHSFLNLCLIFAWSFLAPVIAVIWFDVPMINFKVGEFVVV
jgi:hypothetical protein